jgi:hypothetical protein
LAHSVGTPVRTTRRSACYPAPNKILPRAVESASMTLIPVILPATLTISVSLHHHSGKPPNDAHPPGARTM